MKQRVLFGALKQPCANFKLTGEYVCIYHAFLQYMWGFSFACFMKWGMLVLSFDGLGWQKFNFCLSISKWAFWVGFFFSCVIPFQSLFSIFITLHFFLTQNFHKTTLLKYHFTSSFKGFFPWWLSLQLGLPFTNSTHFSCLILFSTQLWRILSAMTYIIIPELNYFHLFLKVEEY